MKFLISILVLGLICIIVINMYDIDSKKSNANFYSSNYRYEFDEDGYWIINEDEVCIDYVLNLPDHIRFNDDSFKGGDDITIEMKKIRKNMELFRKGTVRFKNEIVNTRQKIEERNKNYGNYDSDDFDVLKQNEIRIQNKLTEDDKLYDKTDKLLEDGIEMQKKVNEFRYNIK